MAKRKKLGAVLEQARTAKERGYKRFRDIKTLKNPSRQEATAFMENNTKGALRGLVYKGDFYIWDGSDALHADILRSLDNMLEVEDLPEGSLFRTTNPATLETMKWLGKGRSGPKA